MLKAVLFDLDGVLIDTEPIYTRFWASIAEEFNLSPTFAAVIKGTTLKSILGYFPEDKREYVAQRIHDFEDTMPYPFFDGAECLLAELREHGLKTAIFTSSDDTKMRYLNIQHPGFSAMFDVVIDGSMVSRSKPDPEGYLRAAEALGVEIHDCAVIEDSLQGLEAGRRSEAKVIGFTTTNPADRVAPLCDLCVADISRLDYEKIAEIFQ